MILKAVTLIMSACLSIIFPKVYVFYPVFIQIFYQGPTINIDELVEGLRSDRYKNIVVLAGAGISCGNFAMFYLILSIRHSGFPFSQWFIP